MAKIDITRPELVWPGKYNEDGTRKEVPRVTLPFQVIETVNESRATRQAKKGGTQTTLFDVWEGKEGDTFEEGWKNKLIWGDNLLVMGALLEKFAGKIDLIYIDPPFATGADFGFSTALGDGDVEVRKEQSIIEEKAYRDTWGSGADSYIDMIMPRLTLARELLADSGSIYVHIGPNINNIVRCLMDEIFGSDMFQREIVWQRVTARSHGDYYPATHDCILFYTRGDDTIWNQQYTPIREELIKSHYTNVEEGTGRRYTLDNCLNQNKNRPNLRYEFNGHVRTWRWTRERMEQLHLAGRLVYTSSGMPRYKRYLDESKGVPLQSVWIDIRPVNSQAQEDTGYDTQKPELLLERIISSSSNPGNLVADFFCGSGTTLAIAEKLGRRWIGCDLGRWAIHVTRKRLLGIENCQPFEVLNLGKYERQYWQGITFGEAKAKPHTERALYEYLAFILKLYGAQPLPGLMQLHGKKGKAMIHIGAVDAPVTIAEIDSAVDECAKLKQVELHVLGWEWEMGLYDLMVEEAKKKSVKLLLLQIPREVMEQQAVDKGDLCFFELAYLEAEVKWPSPQPSPRGKESDLTVRVTLKDFVIPNTELIPEEVRSKVTKWSDYIDYWAVDWDFQNDTFMQGWVAYRTRKERKLLLVTDPHIYERPGKYRILVKVIDIFGNDTTQAFDVEVK
jgi:adenine-specific DNA-methyltransferase